MNNHANSKHLGHCKQKHLEEMERKNKKARKFCVSDDDAPLICHQPILVDNAEEIGASEIALFLAGNVQ